MRFVLMSLVMLAGCATSSSHWAKEGASDADFRADMGYCRAQAFGVPGAMTNLLQVAMVQRSCMEAKGWTVEQ